MNIGIDIDDTIANTNTSIDTFAKEYTEKVLKRNFKINNVYDILDPMWAKYLYGWSIEEDAKFWEDNYELTMENVTIKDGASRVINELYKNNKIIIITARADNQKIRNLTLDWLKENDIHYHKIFMGHLDKKRIIQENNVDIFIDDNFKNCKEASNLGVRTLLMDSRLNKNFNDEKIKRVFSWDEIEKEICG